MAGLGSSSACTRGEPSALPGRKPPSVPTATPAPFDTAKGRWKVAVELEPAGDGRRRRKIVAAATPAEARALARRTREQLAAGVAASPGGPHRGQLPGWWESTVLPGTVSEGSEETYRRLVRLYVVPCLGRVKLTKLTPGHVTEMMRALEDRGLSASTRNAAKKVLGRALRRAMQKSSSTATWSPSPTARSRPGRAAQPHRRPGPHAAAGPTRRPPWGRLRGHPGAGAAPGRGARADLGRPRPRR